LEGTDTKVVIDSGEFNAVKHLNKELKAHGGFALTHTGTLEKIDGSAISAKEVLDLLAALQRFLSFARGFWCGPVLPIGLGGDEECWQLWGSCVLTPFRGVESWFPYSECLTGDRALSKAFGEFMRLWNDPLWSLPLRQLLHWYVEANIGSGALEGSIILNQAALETLGWLHLVEDPSTAKFSATKFNRAKTAEKIRALLDALGIPVQIPSALTGLQAFATTLPVPIQDGPQAIVSFRDALVHPKKTRRARVDQTSFSTRKEAKDLSLWYTEMVLLHLLGYTGSYYQRWVRTTTWDARAQVPWI
jgi:hypothetical protein